MSLWGSVNLGTPSDLRAVEGRDVFVCGGGHQGLAMAAHLALSGCRVSLWNRTAANISAVLETGEVECSGVVKGVARLELVSTDMGEAMRRFVMVATPSSAHKDIARAMAPYVDRDTVVVLNPGRTFGAIEFAETLESCGVSELPHIAETQTIVYTCRRMGGNKARVFAIKRGVRIASLRKGDLPAIMERMPACIRGYFEPVDSIAVTSLGNVGMVLHCAPVLMNAGWIEAPGVAFKYYYDGITPSIASFVEKIDSERLAVADALGCRIESTSDWLRRVYGVRGSSLYECIRNNDAYRRIDAPESIRCRYTEEDIPNGLVPLSHIAKQLGVPTACSDLVVKLGNEVLGIDFESQGRRMDLPLVRKYL